MTKKQQRFVEEYLIDLNATQAAIRAGYSVKFANTNANKILQNTTLQAAIGRAMAERSKRTGVNQDRVVLELAKIAFVNMADISDMGNATIKADASRDDLASICSVRVKTFPCKSGELGIEREIRTYDKIKVLELLGKHLGMFSDKLKIEGSIPVVICDDLGDEDDE